MKCNIISPEKITRLEDVKSITLPAFSGELQILSDHAESFIVLKKGEILFGGGGVNALPIDGGVCYVKNNIAVIVL